MDIEEELKTHDPILIYKQGNLKIALTPEKLIVADWDNRNMLFYDYSSFVPDYGPSVSVFLDPAKEQVEHEDVLKLIFHRGDLHDIILYPHPRQELEQFFLKLKEIQNSKI